MMHTTTDIEITSRITDPVSRMISLIAEIAEHKDIHILPASMTSLRGMALTPAGVRYLAIQAEWCDAYWIRYLQHPDLPPTEWREWGQQNLKYWIPRLRDVRPLITPLDMTVAREWHAVFDQVLGRDPTTTTYPL